MILEAVFERDELAVLLAGFLPVEVDLGEGRALRIAAATSCSLVAGEGVRIDSSAELDWAIAGVDTHVTVPSMRILLRPRIATRGDAEVLEIVPSIESASIAMVPELLEPAIVGALNVAIGRSPLVWDFASALGHRFTLPALLGGLAAMSTRVTAAECEVTASALRLRLSIDVAVERAPAIVPDDAVVGS